MASKVTQATYWQRGEAIDYKNAGEPIAAGQIIKLGDAIGVAAEPIGKNETGSVHIEGVFKIPKKTEAAIELGVVVYLDENEGKATSTKADSEPRLGHSIAKAEAADTEVLVKINV